MLLKGAGCNGQRCLTSGLAYACPAGQGRNGICCCKTAQSADRIVPGIDITLEVFTYAITDISEVDFRLVTKINQVFVWERRMTSCRAVWKDPFCLPPSWS